MLIFDDHTNVYNPDVDEEVYEVDMYNIDQPTRRDNNEEEKLVNVFFSYFRHVHIIDEIDDFFTTGWTIISTGFFL